MIHERWGPQIHYCQRHHMVRNPKTFRWKTVPVDFIAELLEAHLPVGMVARACPGCRADMADETTPPSPWASEHALAPADHTPGPSL